MMRTIETIVPIPEIKVEQLNTNSLKLIAKVTGNWNQLNAIKQILLGFTKAPLVLELIPSDYIIHVDMDYVMLQFKNLNQWRKSLGRG